MEHVGLEILTDPQSLRISYLQAVQGFISRIRRACLDQRIDYALISTADGLDSALTMFLGSRMRRRRSTA
jgi:spore coat polysaccharide biosynthesis protein SpsF (cytidylyltransferase family)